MNKVKVTPPPSLTVPLSIFVCCLHLSLFLFLSSAVSVSFLRIYFILFFIRSVPTAIQEPSNVLKTDVPSTACTQIDIYSR